MATNWILSRERKKEGQLTLGRRDDGNDEAVNAEHTSHDDGNDGAHYKLGAHDTHGSHADARLGSAIGGTEVCKERKEREAKLASEEVG